jgi:hypothetical protein
MTAGVVQYPPRLNQPGELVQRGRVSQRPERRFRPCGRIFREKCGLRLPRGGSFRYYRQLCLAALQAASGYRRLADCPARLALPWPRSRLTTLAEEALAGPSQFQGLLKLRKRELFGDDFVDLQPAAPQVSDCLRKTVNLRKRAKPDVVFN